MKSILTIIAIAISLNAFAGTETKTAASAAENQEVINNVSSQICADDVVTELGINGQADISFTVDAEGYVHVSEVQSNDFLFEYHIRKALEGMKLSVTESIVGKTFTFIMNAVQPD